MHWWGFSIDNVVVIFLVISLGLSVDYSAHIAHAFLVATGTPNERMIKALTEMGPAVINGATSTFIAVIALGAANSYVFETFFRCDFIQMMFDSISNESHFCVKTLPVTNDLVPSIDCYRSLQVHVHWRVLIQWSMSFKKEVNVFHFILVPGIMICS